MPLQAAPRTDDSARIIHSEFGPSKAIRSSRFGGADTLCYRLWPRGGGCPPQCPPTPVRMPATRAATGRRQGTGPAYSVAIAPARTRTGYAVRTEQQDPREVRPRITGRDLPVTPMLIHGSGFCRVGQVPLRSPLLPYGFSASVVGRGEQWPYPQGRRWTSVP